MLTFTKLEELIRTLNREQQLITQLFKARKTFNYHFQDALPAVDHDKNRIYALVERSVIRQNGDILELEELFLDFFEQILEVGDDINTDQIDKNIAKIKDHIDYYQNEAAHNHKRRNSYLGVIKRALKTIGLISLKSVIDLERYVENAFKSEPNYKTKKTKLENADQKRQIILDLIDQTRNLIEPAENNFFSPITDQNLQQIITDLKRNLVERQHNLVEIENQIIEYLNQIKYQSRLLKKIRQLQYLKNEFLIEQHTNIRTVLDANRALIFEAEPRASLKLSLTYLQTDDTVLKLLKRLARRNYHQVQTKLTLATEIKPEFLKAEPEQIISMINNEDLKNSFKTSSHDLFQFILQHEFEQDLSLSKRVTLYCQIVSQFEHELEIKNQFKIIDNIEYALVYPK